MRRGMVHIGLKEHAKAAELLTLAVSAPAQVCSLDCYRQGAYPAEQNPGAPHEPCPMQRLSTPSPWLPTKSWCLRRSSARRAALRGRRAAGFTCLFARVLLAVPCHPSREPWSRCRNTPPALCCGTSKPLLPSISSSPTLSPGAAGFRHTLRTRCPQRSPGHGLWHLPAAACKRAFF